MPAEAVPVVQQVAPYVPWIVSFVTSLFDNDGGGYSEAQNRMFDISGDRAELEREARERELALYGPSEDALGNLYGPRVDALNMIMGYAEDVGGRSRGRIQARPFNPFGAMRDVQTFGANYPEPTPFTRSSYVGDGNGDGDGDGDGGWTDWSGWRDLPGLPIPITVDVPTPDLGGAWRDLFPDAPGGGRFGEGGWPEVDISGYRGKPGWPEVDISGWRGEPGWPEVDISGWRGEPGWPDVDVSGWRGKPGWPDVDVSGYLGKPGWPDVDVSGWRGKPGWPDVDVSGWRGEPGWPDVDVSGWLDKGPGWGDFGFTPPGIDFPNIRDIVQDFGWDTFDPRDFPTGVPFPGIPTVNSIGDISGRVMDFLRGFPGLPSSLSLSILKNAPGDILDLLRQAPDKAEDIGRLIERYLQDRYPEIWENVGPVDPYLTGEERRSEIPGYDPTHTPDPHQLYPIGRPPDSPVDLDELASGASTLSDIFNFDLKGGYRGPRDPFQTVSSEEHVQGILAEPDSKIYSVLTAHMTDEEIGWLTQEGDLTQVQKDRLNEVLGRGYGGVQELMQWMDENIPVGETQDSWLSGLPVVGGLFEGPPMSMESIYPSAEAIDAYIVGGVQGLDRWFEQKDADRWANTPDRVLAEYGMERTEDGTVRRIVTEGSMFGPVTSISSIITEQEAETRDLNRQAAADAIINAETAEQRESARRAFNELAKREFADV